MTQKEIIWRPEEIVAMCKEAGFADGMASIVGLWGLHEFARIVAAKERKACAEICDVEQKKNEDKGQWMWEAKLCGIAIRARGEA